MINFAFSISPKKSQRGLIISRERVIICFTLGQARKLNNLMVAEVNNVEYHSLRETKKDLNFPFLDPTKRI